MILQLSNLNDVQIATWKLSKDVDQAFKTRITCSTKEIRQRFELYLGQIKTCSCSRQIMHLKMPTSAQMLVILHSLEGFTENPFLLNDARMSQSILYS